MSAHRFTRVNRKGLGERLDVDPERSAVNLAD